MRSVGAIVVALSWLVAAPSGAQTERGPSGPEAYQIAPDWAHARPTGRVRDGLAEIEAVAHGRAQRAWIGPAAIVELAGDAAPAWREHGVRSARRIATRPALWLVEGARGEDGLALAARLRAAGLARTATPDLYFPRTTRAIDVPPDDPRYGGQWYLETIGIEAAWAIETGDPAVSIVIVDNGCEMTHPDLAAVFLGGRDVRDMDDDPSPGATTPGAEHGTACAGVAAAVGDNGVGIAGVCPECTLHCVRLLGDDGALTPISSDVAAFEYARTVGARVVSNSWGFSEAVSVPGTLRAVIEGLFDDGILVVFAAGNDNRELFDDELTAVRGVITVGALNLFDEVAPFSNFGPSLDLTAPTGTLATDLTGPAGESDGDYTSLFGGTSSSCPVVAGVAGLMFSAAPDATAAQIHDALIATTRAAPFAVPDAMGHDDHHGYGIVDPAAALRAVAPDVGADAGVGDVDAGAGPPPSDGCACRAGASRGGAGGLALTSVALWIGARRRGRRRSRGGAAPETICAPRREPRRRASPPGRAP